MKARDVMSKDPACCTADDTIQKAAKLMEDCDCGLIPVVNNIKDKKLAGVITDRDIAIRAIAKGKGIDCLVKDCMSQDVSACGADDDLDKIEEIMADRQVRRVPIIDGNGAVIGIVAQADLVRSDAASGQEVKQVVERISEPAGAHAHH